MDVFTRYANATGDVVARRLAHPSEWKVSSVTSDVANPNVWDPDETATISFSVLQKPQNGAKGTLAIAVPGGFVDSAYFDAEKTCYLHNDPTPPTGDTISHLVLPMDGTEPSATTLYNYDTDRDAAAGLLIEKGGSGPGEADPVLHQAWRTSPLGSDLGITGDVSIDFWSALVDFQLSPNPPKDVLGDSP